MTVSVVNQRIKDHHIAERIEIIFAQIPQIFGDLFYTLGLAEPPHRNKGVVNIGKEFTHAAKAAFPLGKCVRNMVKLRPVCFIKKTENFYENTFDQRHARKKY